MADDDVTQDEHEDEPSKEDGNLKRLREKAAKADSAERELVFLKAGIDTDTAVGKLALRGYDGDLTVDAVKAFGTEIGAIGAAPTTPAVEITDDERALAQDRQILAGARTDPVEDQGEHPALQGVKEFHGAIQRGVPRDNASGHFFDRVFDAAAKGDPRVLYDPDRFKQEIGY